MKLFGAIKSAATIAGRFFCAIARAVRRRYPRACSSTKWSKVCFLCRAFKTFLLKPPKIRCNPSLVLLWVIVTARQEGFLNN